MLSNGPEDNSWGVLFVWVVCFRGGFIFTKEIFAGLFLDFVSDSHWMLSINTAPVTVINFCTFQNFELIS